MNGPGRGNLLWRKAAVLGSLWAASEIVLGSFLKNAHIPFAGLLLTGIGIAILIAGHRLWPERGLLWRAGLICAAMKSVSPSAVLLSPMVAIFAEGLLAEAAVRLLGGNTAGYIIAGGLAMSWGLLHKLGKLYLFYGPDSLALYVKGLEKLRAWLGQPGGRWEPLLAVLVAYFLAGVAAALVGLRAAAGGELAPLRSGGRELFKPRSGGAAGYYSAFFLVLHLAVVSGLMVAGRLPLPVVLGLSLVYASVCARYYRRSAALLAKTGMWAGIAAVSLLAGWLLGDWGSGLRMAARAFALTLGFAAVAQELLNPRVRRAVERGVGPAFFETLEYAFATLPLVLGSLPSGRDMLLRPAASLRAVISRAPCLLERPRRRVFIITGEHGSGKSSLAAALAGLLRAAGQKPAGIIAEGYWEQDKRAGFELLDLASGARTSLCRREPGGETRAGEFRFFAEGLAAGRAAFSAEKLSAAGAIFLDEVGFLELEGGGWAPQLEGLLGENGPDLILVARDYLLERIISRWRIKPCAVWKAGETGPAAALGAIRSAVDLPRPTC
ncbi:MAG: nucleoside-triphosphatase [Geobacter sp.]